MAPNDQIKAFIDRVIRLKEEQDELSSDIRDVYAEAKAMGYDKTAMGEVVAYLRKVEKKGKDAIAERGAIFDMYLEAYERPSHTHAREGRSDAGLNIVTKHTEITASPETATECAAPEKDAAADERSVEADGGAALVRTLSDQLREGGNNAQQVPQHVVSDRRHHSQGDKNTEKPQAAEQAGGEHEVAIGSAMRAGLADPTSNTGEGAASALPATDEFLEDVPPMPMKRLHYAHCFPELNKAEYGRLEFSIIGIGVSKPIIRMGDVIVDGWARYNICRTLGISYPIQNYSGNDVLLDVIEWQRASRNFTPAQEKKIAADLAKEIPHRANDIMAAFGLADEALEAAE